MDPLDTLMIVLAIILSISGYLIYVGYGLITVGILLALYAYCYRNAPSRKFPTALEITDGVDLTGKVAFVTGTTSGIGFDTAQTLALRGAKVYMAARNMQKLRESKKQMMTNLGIDFTPTATHKKMNTENDDKLVLVQCDLNDLDSVKNAAEQFLKQEQSLDILINNAGVMTLPEFRPTVQGLEQQVGICHVGHFYLTKLLLPALQLGAAKSSLTRVVCLSSSGHRFQKLNELLTNPRLETVPYDPEVAYGNAKACNMFHAKEFHKRYYTKLTTGSGSGKICAFSVMPGGIFTGLQTHTAPWKLFKWKVVAPFFFKTTSQGAATTLLCATTANPDKDGGKYFDNCAPTNQTRAVEDEVGKDVGNQMWNVTEELLKTLGYH